MTTTVEVRGLSVDRGRRRVLDDLDLDVGPGVVGLLGPSGCGKTTLLRCVVGVQRVASGTVRVLGHAAGSPPVRDRVGYLTQSASVYDDLTVEENLRFFARVLDVDGEEVEQCLGAVDLVGERRRTVGRLSGGQRARASLAVALIGGPDLLVLDEPTVGLDPVLRRELWALFARLAEAGTTVLVSSHVMDEAERCDRLLLMRRGELIAHGTPDAVKQSSGARDVESAFLAIVESGGTTS